MRVQQPGLLDHRIGKREHLIRNIEVDRLRGFDIDNQLELGRLFNRQIGRFCTFCYSVNIFSNSSEDGGKVWPVR